MGLRTLALALGHTCWLEPMPYFFLVEELKKLRLKTLLWGQRSGSSGLRRGWDLAQSLGIQKPVGPGLPYFPRILSPDFTISLPLSQCFPVKCSGQIQCGPCGMFTQVPPFWQGLCLLQWSERWTQ